MPRKIDNQKPVRVTREAYDSLAAWCDAAPHRPSRVGVVSCLALLLTDFDDDTFAAVLLGAIESGDRQKLAKHILKSISAGEVRRPADDLKEAAKRNLAGTPRVRATPPKPRKSPRASGEQLPS